MKIFKVFHPLIADSVQVINAIVGNRPDEVCLRVPNLGMLLGKPLHEGFLDYILSIRPAFQHLHGDTLKKRLVQLYDLALSQF